MTGLITRIENEEDLRRPKLRCISAGAVHSYGFKLRYELQTVSPPHIACAGRMNETGKDCCFFYYFTSLPVPSLWHGKPDFGGVCK